MLGARDSLGIRMSLIWAIAGAPNDAPARGGSAHQAEPRHKRSAASFLIQKQKTISERVSSEKTTDRLALTVRG